MPPKPDFLDLIGKGADQGIDAFRQQQRDQADLILALRQLGQKESQAQAEDVTRRMKIRQEGEQGLIEQERNAKLDQSLIDLRRAQTEAANALSAHRRSQSGGKVTRKEFMMEANRLFNVYMTEERKKNEIVNPNDPMGLFGAPKAAPVPQSRIRELQAQARRETIRTMMPEEWAKQQAEKEAIGARVRGSVPGAAPVPQQQGQTFNRMANPIFENLPEVEPGEETFDTPFGPMSKQQMLQALKEAQVEGADITDPDLLENFLYVFGPAE